MAIWILSGTADGGEMSGAVLFDVQTLQAFGPVFDDEADAAGFLEWCGGDPRGTCREGVSFLAKTWRVERDWPKCRCGTPECRVEPGHEVCGSCECDLTYEAEQAAKGDDDAADQS